MMPPSYTGYWFDPGSETLPGRTEPAFDLFTAAETAADLSLRALLNPVRAERLVAQSALDPAMPSLNEVVESVGERLLKDLANSDSPRMKTISQRLLARFAATLMALDATGGSAQVQASARAGLRNLARQTQRVRGMRDFADWMTTRIDSHLDRPAPPSNPSTPGPDVPPGSPIGSKAGPGSLEWVAEGCWHCGY